MAGNHTRVNILVEGQTEETFVRELLAPHLAGFQVYLTPRIIETSKGHKGGVVSYGKIERLIARWPSYRSAKPHFGVLLALEIGLTIIRQKCFRFDQWVNTLEGL